MLVTIAGFDPSSGAGLTADLKTFAAHRFFGVSCATALTVQSTCGVRRSVVVDPELVSETLDCLGEDMEIGGVKVGMLGNAGVVSAVAAWLRRLPQGAIPIVVDPVLQASSGAALLEPDGIQLLRSQILPLATVVTPNVEEAAILTELGRSKHDAEAVPALARAVLEIMLPGRGCAAVVTGGHLAASPDDYLLQDGETEGQWFEGRWVRTTSTHGTGCAFSSSLLCALVQGLPLPEAVRAAKQFVHGALEAAYPVGKGRGPLHHLFNFDRRDDAPSAPSEQDQPSH